MAKYEIEIPDGAKPVYIFYYLPGDVSGCLLEPIGEPQGVNPEDLEKRLDYLCDLMSSAQLIMDLTEQDLEEMKKA